MRRVRSLVPNEHLLSEERIWITHEETARHAAGIGAGGLGRGDVHRKAASQEFAVATGSGPATTEERRTPLYDVEWT